MSGENEKILAKQRLTEFLETKKMRKTPERFKILDVIYSQSGFFDAESLKKNLDLDYPVSLATIYNALELFLQCNLIIRHTFGLRVKYEKTPVGSSHYYQICMQCGNYKSFTDLKLKKSISLRTFSAFNITNHSLYFYGICKKCGQKNKKQNR
ncbi:MAG: transcriptional repressor [Prevotellaceae bacterium]|jgi:Fur family ferric uptake transcriptional regulator|nr:transcriptional repressor [Prevotellaceae bacterium]